MNEPVSAALTAHQVRIARDGTAIRVTWWGCMQQGDLEVFRSILADLVDGQGNRAVMIDLPDLQTAQAPLLEVLLEIEQRLAARSGTLTVTTQASDSASWAPRS